MMQEHGPERAGGQGLDPNQFESGDRTLLALLATAPASDQVDLVATHRDGAYEIWSRRGMVRFKRYVDDHGALVFKLIEQIGENPVNNQDPFAVSTIAEELSAAALSGNPADDANRAFHEPHVLTHPYAYERIAQLFDSPRAPDLAVSAKPYAYGIQPGQHGALDVVQCRAPLVFAGPGVRSGSFRVAARHVDIAPTIAHLMGFPTIDGAGAAGQPARTYLKRQDGRTLDEIVDAPGAARLVYLILLDGLSHSELVNLLEHNAAAIPNLAALVERGAMLSHGSIVNFPSITWPSHSTILTGAWCGHHGVVNPTFHLRERRETIPIQGNVFEMEGYLDAGVETLYEAFKRVHGAGAITASINEPQGRGADHAPFERRIVGDKTRLKALTAEMSSDVSPRWLADKMPEMQREEIVDIRGMAQALNLFDHCGEQPPMFVAHEFVLTDGAGHDYGPHHEGLREAIYRTDARIGTIFEMLKKRGLFDSTLFVMTSDHGMAAQRIELKANPSCEPAKSGIKGVFAEPMIYLRDLQVEVERARDLRSIRVTVLHNDQLPDGEHPPVARAGVVVRGREGAVLGEATTQADGRVAFATPANVADREIEIRVEHQDFNARTLRGDGSSVLPDLRAALYGNL
ncbi:MAG TPA: alkaline phosphatase family protein [Candidatus Binataceae bacterium]